MRGIFTDDISLGLELTTTHRALVYVTVPARRAITPEMQATMRAVTASTKDLLTRHLPAIPPVHLIHKEGPIMGWRVEWDDFVSWVQKSNDWGGAAPPPSAARSP